MLLRYTILICWWVGIIKIVSCSWEQIHYTLFGKFAKELDIDLSNIL